MAIAETEQPLLYNSSIIDVYLRFIARHYPETKTQDLLRAAGIRSYESADPGHWFSQDQIDRFHDTLVQMTGNSQIAREAGLFAASPDGMGLMRRYVLGMVKPATLFHLIGQGASRMTRSATYEARILSDTVAEITVTPREGIHERSFQCENRIGFFEAIVLLLTHRLPRIDHTECLFRGGNVCRYRIEWQEGRSVFRKKIRNLAALACGVALPVIGFHWPAFALHTALPSSALLLSLLQLSVSKATTSELQQSLAELRAATDQTMTQANQNYNNALVANEIGQAVSRKNSLSDILDSVIHILQQRLDFKRGALLLPDDAKTCLQLRRTFGYTPEEIAFFDTNGILLEPRQIRAPFQTCYHDQTPILINSRSELVETFPDIRVEFIRRLGTEAFILCPILSEEETLGVLAVTNPAPRRPLVQSDLSLLMAIASSIGISIRNAQLLETMSQQLQEIRTRDEQLELYQEKLEELVVQRTRELHEALRQAEEASLAKSQFLANMSHEIRTPMYGVLGLNDILLQSDLDDKQKRLARMVSDSGKTLLGIIDSILDFAKIEAGRVELEDLDFDLGKLLASTLEIFEPQAAARNLCLTLNIDPGIPACLRGDPGRLRQVLTNLVGNAIKFTPKGGVSLHVHPDGKDSGKVRIRFEVTDTGIGISADKLTTIFDTFQQADGSTSRKFGGTGLGTSIAKHLVELMGGKIGCESTPGRGSTFWFMLPLESVTSQELSPPEKSASLGRSESSPDSRGRRILVVEDNPTNREIVQTILVDAGYEVALAENGKIGVDMVAAKAFDLVVMDIQMPEMDGYEATRTIRNMGGWQNLPIIALTANATEEDKEKCVSAGMDAVVTKPMTRDHFLQVIAEHMRHGISPQSLKNPEGSLDQDSSSPLDMTTALKDFQLEESVFLGIVAYFLKGASIQREKLAILLEQNNLPQIAREAHSIRGGAANLHAGRVARAAGALEKQAKAGLAKDLSLLMKGLECEFDHLETFLRNLQAERARDAAPG